MACYDLRGCYRQDGTPCWRPCGQCIGCRLEASRQWAVRVVLECKMYNENCFITLTYRPEDLPDSGNVVKVDFVKFMKRLRKNVEPRRIRFFACGEYGEKFKRPHYHAIIFNYDFDDKEIIEHKRRWKSRFSKKPYENLYKSENLAKLWKKGFVTVGEATFDSAAYIARYCTKKVTGKNSGKHYAGLEPEFALMSRMPGIGEPFFQKYFRDVYPKDFITIGGIKQRPPRYFDYLYQKKFPEEYEKLKERRLKNQLPRDYHKRLFQREQHRKLITRTLNRRLEDEAN